jgi:predicted NAD-dependent protein-ADP-ribosyltransferase YbiA (DUF1768 family)
MLKLSNPNSYPFGLLNNKANTPFTLGGQVWASVAEYVYTNMFKDDDLRKKMREHIIGGNQYEYMLNLKRKRDDDIYQKSLLKALKLRFDQYPALRNALGKTRGKELVYNIPDIVILLNNIRSDINYVFDPLRGVEVPRKEVLSVIAGVEKELLQNPKLDDNLKYTDLLQFASRPTTEIPPGDKIFLNINNIVPLLKLRLKTKIWENEVEKFKPHLLDVYLNHILETEYPQIRVDDYNEAKKQQYAKERDIDTVKNQLFNMYQVGNVPQFILDKLKFTPDKSLLEKSKKQEELDEEAEAEAEDVVLETPDSGVLDEILDLMKTNPAGRSEKIVLNESSPFLPHFPELVRVDGMEFATCVHYAYFKMVEQYGGTTFSINEVPLNDLSFVYQEHKNTWMFETIKAMNENATIQKLTEYKSLVFLLLSTKKLGDIIYDDPDAILGSRGENIAGKFLMHLRDDRVPAFMHPTDSMSKQMTLDNIWMKTWFKHMVKDYHNTLMLLKNENAIKSLEIIYRTKPFSSNGALISPSNNDLLRLKYAGVDHEEAHIIFPFIVAEYDKLTNGLLESKMFDREVERFIVLSRRPTKNDINSAKENLLKVYKRVGANVKPARFAASILANKLTEHIEYAKTWKINIWKN